MKDFNGDLNILHKTIKYISSYSIFYPIIVLIDTDISACIDTINKFAEQQIFSPIVISEIDTNNLKLINKKIMKNDKIRKLFFLNINENSDEKLLKYIHLNQKGHQSISFQIVFSLNKSKTILSKLSELDLQYSPTFIDPNRKFGNEYVYDDSINPFSNIDSCHCYLYCQKCPEWIIFLSIIKGKRSINYSCKGGIKYFSIEYVGDNKIKVKPCLHSNKFVLTSVNNLNIAGYQKTLESIICLDRKEKIAKCNYKKCILETMPHLRETCLSCPYIDCDEIKAIKDLLIS